MAAVAVEREQAMMTRMVVMTDSNHVRQETAREKFEKMPMRSSRPRAIRAMMKVTSDHLMSFWKTLRASLISLGSSMVVLPSLMSSALICLVAQSNWLLVQVHFLLSSEEQDPQSVRS